MAIQFSSFVKPLIIMAAIPFSFTGGFLALVITGTSLNVVSFIGLIMLMGVIVNNAIVMLEKIAQLHAEGMPHYTAVQEACYERLRPILMTTLTTILALLPMAIGIGKGSELMQPLGIVVMGGLLIGTLVTLALIPAVYCIFHGLSAKYPEGKRKAKKQAKQNA
jgi:HAE1 family hydrophobic/amphiphilic exporter-1